MKHIARIYCIALVIYIFFLIPLFPDIRLLVKIKNNAITNASAAELLKELKTSIELRYIWDVVHYYYILALIEKNEAVEARKEIEIFKKVHSASPFIERIPYIDSIIRYYTVPFDKFLSKTTESDTLLYCFRYFKDKEQKDAAYKTALKCIDKYYRRGEVYGLVNYVVGHLKEQHPKKKLDEILRNDASFTNRRLFKIAYLLYKNKDFINSVRLFKYLNDDMKIIESTYYLGIIFYKKADYIKALSYLKKAKEYAGRIKEPDYLYWTNFYIIRSHEKLKNYTASFRLAQEVIHTYPDERFFQVIIRVAENLSHELHVKYKNQFLRKHPYTYLAYIINKKDAFTALRGGDYDRAFRTLENAYAQRQDDVAMLKRLMYKKDLSDFIFNSTDLFYNHFFFQTNWGLAINESVLKALAASNDHYMKKGRLKKDAGAVTNLLHPI
ncbi:tol-pal system YbgF family protein, partial [Spirochaetota bacterium]